MKAKYVNKRIGFCFDFDDTLVKTKAKVQVYKDNKYVTSLNPNQYSVFINSKRSKGDYTFDFVEFNDPYFVERATPIKMFYRLRNINNEINSGNTKYELFVLTARSLIMRNAIFNFLKNNGINNIKEHNIFTIGDDKGNIDIAEEKRKILERIANSFQEVYFYDDDPNNIIMAKDIYGLRAKLVEGYINKIKF